MFPIVARLAAAADNAIANLAELNARLQSPSVEGFLGEHGNEAIRRAVKKAESRTSGEIRVSIAAESRNPLAIFASDESAVKNCALKEFYSLGMHKTKDRTGVLIYISLAEGLVFVRADTGINSKVQPGTWDSAVKTILKGIGDGNALGGICAAVEQVGQILAQHFPIQPGDINELPDSVAVIN